MTHRIRTVLSKHTCILGEKLLKATQNSIQQENTCILGEMNLSLEIKAVKGYTGQYSKKILVF